MSLPTQEEFATSAAQALATTEDTQFSYRQKANDLYDDLRAGDLGAVTQDLACG